MGPQEHTDFLRQRANEIDALLSTKAVDCFHARIKTFIEMRLVWERSVEQAQRDAQTEPGLRQEPENEKAEPPKKGYIWDYYLGFWRSENSPPDPLAWLRPLGSSPTRPPTDDEKLTCDYFLLAVVHDGALPDITDKRIYFRWAKNNMWTDLNGGSIAAIPAEAMQLWKEISEWNNDQELFELPRIRCHIERALEHVKADLGEEPAETGRKTTPGKGEGENRLWKLYEITLKVIIDAVLKMLRQG